MRDDELKNLVDELLYLVEVGSGNEAVDEAELAHLLDRLALAVRHGVDPGAPDPMPEIPARNFDVLHKVATSRFPSFGGYVRPRSFVGSKAGAADRVEATRDLATIADPLHVVAWLWRNATWDVGLWYLYDSYRQQWGTAMRCLQLYLHERDVER